MVCCLYFCVFVCVQRPTFQRRSGCVCVWSQWAVWTQLYWILNWQPRTKWCCSTTHTWGWWQSHFQLFHEGFTSFKLQSRLKLVIIQPSNVWTWLFPRDISGYVLWCRKGYFTMPAPQAKPRSLDFRGLSLEQPSAPQPLRPRYITTPPQKKKIRAN